MTSSRGRARSLSVILLCIEFNSPMVISTYRFFCILYLYHTGLPVRFNENQDGPAAYNVLNYFVSLRSEILCLFFLLWFFVFARSMLFFPWQVFCSYNINYWCNRIGVLYYVLVPVAAFHLQSYLTVV